MERDLWEQLDRFAAISFIVIATSTLIGAISFTVYAGKIDKKLDVIVNRLTSLNGQVSSLGKEVDALNNIDETLKKIELANDRTKLLDEIAPGLIDVLKTAFGNEFEKADENSLAEKIRAFLAARGTTATDTLVQELTKATLCKVVGIACGPSVTVNAPIVIQPPSVMINSDPAAPPNFPPTIIFEQIGSQSPINTVSAGSELHLYMSVWFTKTNTTDDQGATEKLIVPRIKRHIGARKDCKIFVSGNADTAGVDSYNRDLSEQRAAVVSKSLQTTFGDMVDSKPIANGERSLLNWSVDGSHNIYNRRADILVTCGQ